MGWAGPSLEAMRPLMITLLATLLLAAPASAARFQHTGPDVDFTVAATDVVKLTVTGHKLGDPRQLTFTRGTGATPSTIGAGCSIFINTGIASCFVGSTTRLRLTTNDKPDTIDASGTATPFDASVPEVFDTKGGDDALIAGPLADTVDAGDGDDAITGGTGADQLRGRAGDDRFTGLTPGDLVDGGAGADLLDLSGDVGGGVSISLNGVADDGPLGSDANVLGIETVRATPSADVLTGGTAAERPRGRRRRGHDRHARRRCRRSRLRRGRRLRARRRGRPAHGLRAHRAAAAGRGRRGRDVSGRRRRRTRQHHTRRWRGRVRRCRGRAVRRPRRGRRPGRPGLRRQPPQRAPGGARHPRQPHRQDCDGSDGKRSLAGGRLSFDFLTFRDGSTKVATLLGRDLATGGRAELRCKGPGCRGLAKRAGKRGKGGAVNLRKLIRRRLRAGAVLEVRITAPDATGRVIRFKMRRGQRQKRTTLCLAPRGEAAGAVRLTGPRGQGRGCAAPAPCARRGWPGRTAGVACPADGRSLRAGPAAVGPRAHSQSRPLPAAGGDGDPRRARGPRRRPRGHGRPAPDRGGARRAAAVRRRPARSRRPRPARAPQPAARPIRALFAGRRSLLVQAPRGTVGVRGGASSPWAEPVLETGAALLAGNAVVLSTPLGERVRAAFERGGVPLELIALVASGDDLGALASHVVDTRPPRQKGTMLALDGAPLERTATGALWAAFAGGGRHRAAVGRLVVVPSVAEPLIDAVVATARRLRPGDPRQPETEVGPCARPRRARGSRSSSPRLSRTGPSCCAAARSTSTAWRARSTTGGAARCPTDARLLHEPVPGPVLAVVEAGVGGSRRSRSPRAARPCPCGAATARAASGWRAPSAPRSRGSTSMAIRSLAQRCGWPPTSTRAASPPSPRGCARRAGSQLDPALVRASTATARLQHGRESERLGVLRSGALPLARTAARLAREALDR